MSINMSVFVLTIAETTDSPKVLAGLVLYPLGMIFRKLIAWIDYCLSYLEDSN